MNSGRGQANNRFFPKTDFVVHFSGTLFLLAASIDTKRVLRQLNVGWSIRPEAKWQMDPSHVLQIAELKKDWKIVVFCHFIQSFYLRRAGQSKWDGEFIIPKGIKAPVPFLGGPEDPFAMIAWVSTIAAATVS